MIVCFLNDAKSLEGNERNKVNEVEDNDTGSIASSNEKGWSKSKSERYGE